MIILNVEKELSRGEITTREMYVCPYCKTPIDSDYGDRGKPMCCNKAIKFWRSMLTQIGMAGVEW